MAGPSATYVAKPAIEVAITYMDATREVSVTLLRFGYGDGSYTAADLITAVTGQIGAWQGPSNAVISQVRVAFVIEGTSLSWGTADGSFISVDTSQKTNFLVGDSENKLASTAAPIASMFQSNMEDIDLTNTVYTAWVAAVLSITINSAAHAGQDEDNQDLTSALYGKMQWRRRKGGSKPS